MLVTIEWQWTTTEQTAFARPIECLTTSPILAYADLSKPFILHTDASCTGLGAVLYQKQAGLKRVIAYASRGLSKSERNYPAHKLEFLALKWAVCDKFHDYLYGPKFEVITDNNPLTYALSSAKLDADGHRWLAALANYELNIKYRPGSQNIDADTLSRLPSGPGDDTDSPIFPTTIQWQEVKDDSVSAICQALQLGPEDCPLAESLILNPSGIINILEDNLILFSQRAALHISKDQWLRLQTADDGISPLLPYLRQGIHPSKREILGMSRTSRLLVREWGKLVLKSGIVYRRSQVNNQNVLQLILPSGMKEEVIAGLHDDVGHMGEDRVHELALLRFYWPCMARDIKKYIQRCQRCICHKTPPTAQPVAPLVNIESKQPLDILCIDFLSIERSKGGIENVLVVTDHSTRYSVAIPTRNQTANTAARALVNDFIAHYGFPARLHSDQGRNFESKVIKELCYLARTSKSQTTPYHPAGNGLCKRFNRTLLNMLGTLSDVQKQDWKNYLPAMTHGYNATQHSSTGYSPFYLMFGRQPRLAIDVCLDLEQVTESSGKEETSYIKSLRQRLSMAYQLAVEASRKAKGKQKKQYDRKARPAVLQPHDLVLVRLLAFQGKHKLSNRWEKGPISLSVSLTRQYQYMWLR